MKKTIETMRAVVFSAMLTAAFGCSGMDATRFIVDAAIAKKNHYDLLRAIRPGVVITLDQLQDIAYLMSEDYNRYCGIFDLATKSVTEDPRIADMGYTVIDTQSERGKITCYIADHGTILDAIIARVHLNPDLATEEGYLGHNLTLCLYKLRRQLRFKTGEELKLWRWENSMGDRPRGERNGAWLDDDIHYPRNKKWMDYRAHQARNGQGME
ncbi:MAG: hypothetical protein LBF54_01265 [Holosporaceae bacterium]|nr:hypothetical protein [Holosporaceae bacterium]